MIEANFQTNLLHHDLGFECQAPMLREDERQLKGQAWLRRGWTGAAQAYRTGGGTGSSGGEGLFRGAC